MKELVVVGPEAAVHVEGGGNRLTICVAGARTGGAFSSVDFRVAPGFVAPPLFHANTREDWWGQVLEGEIAVEDQGGATRIVGAGGWVYVPRGTPFRWWNARSEPARWLLSYAPGGFEQYFVELAEAMAQSPPRGPEGLAAPARPLWARYGVVVSPSKG
jgi:mannose-6-phosphate isomerase-like protein (cupin superfamily)